MDEAALVADGWSRVETDGFSAAIGPLWKKGTPDGLILGLNAGPEVCNNRADTVHGGALMTFADLSLGFGACHAMGHAHCTTVQLQFQFVAAAKVGELVTCEPEVVRKTRQLIFLRGLFEAGGRTVGSADAIFKFFDPPAGS